MNPILWLITWLFVSLFPVTRKYLKNPIKIFSIFSIALIVAVVTIMAKTNDVTMVWLLLIFKLIFTITEWFFAHESYGYYNSNKLNLRKTYKLLTFLGIYFLIITMVAGAWQGTIMQSFNNAVNFDRTIEYMPDGTPIFNTEVPNNMLRLTTDELARNIVLRNIAHFGSNVKILSNHVTTYNGRLVWVATIGSSDTWTDNKVRGFVIVDANNPEIEPEIIDKDFLIGEGLVWFPPFHSRGIKGVGYGMDTSIMYGRAYLTPNEDNEWKYVMTSTSIQQWSFIKRPHGVYVFNEYGYLEDFYRMNEIPSWIAQMYDEGWMEQMVSNWGNHKRGGGFDMWAGGLPLLINPSTDRIEIHDDTRFIVDPDTGDIIALIAVDPKGKQETLAGMFKFSRDGIQYYNLRPYNIMSGRQAQNSIESEILKRTTGTFQARMPLLYPIGDTYAWFSPIYWEGEQEGSYGHETIRLSGLGIVEANDLDHIAIVMTSEGFKGEDLVAEAKRRFLEGYEVIPEPTEITTLNGTLTYKYSYVANGNTIYILLVDGTDVTVYTNKFEPYVISQINQLEIGSYVKILVHNGEFTGFQ